MGRERPDMFDVACGECELVDFLLTRFDVHDLQTKITLARTCILDEQFAPSPDPADEGPVPPVPASVVPLLVLSQPPLPPAPGSTAEVEPQQPSPSAAAPVEDLMSLIQGFHAAAQRYQEEVVGEPADVEED